MAASWFLASLSAASWVVFFYPYLLYPLALRSLPHRPVRARPTELRVSLLFCAFNEIDCLPAKLENLRQLRNNFRGLEILAYDDGSTDGTFELLSSVPDLLTTIRGPGRKGKAAGMKRMVRQSRGDILVFTDADVIVQPGAIGRLLPYYGDSEVGGVSGTVRMLSAAGEATARVGSLYGDLDDKLQQLESRTGNVMGASGALFSVRRELYPEFPETVQDDFAVSMSVIFQGRRLVKAPDVTASTRSVTDRREELRRKVRIGTRAYLTHAFLRPQLKRMSRVDRFKYVSRKMLRWHGALFLSLGTIFGLAAVAMLSAPAAAILLVALSIAVAAPVERGLLGPARSIATATFATSFGVVQGMRGRTVTTWAPAKSR